MDAIKLNSNLREMTDRNSSQADFSDHAQRTTGLTLAALGELIGGVVSEVVGNDVSSDLNGSPVTTRLISEIAMADIFQRIIKARQNGVSL